MSEYTEDCCFNDTQDYCRKQQQGGCPCRCHLSETPRPANEQELLAEVERCHRLLRDSDTARIRMNHRRIEAEQQLAAERARAERAERFAALWKRAAKKRRVMEQTAAAVLLMSSEQFQVENARAERAEADLAAERERNQPLRDRIKALQDQHDQDTQSLRRSLARYHRVWFEAEQKLGEDRDGWWWHPSEFQKAVYGILQERAEAAEGREARLRESWQRVLDHIADCRVCTDPLWAPIEQECVGWRHVWEQARAALAGTPEGEQ